MIVKNFMVTLILSVALISDAIGASLSNVYVGSEIIPVEYAQYGAPYTSLANPRLSQYNALSSLPGYLSPCGSPCVYPNPTVATVTPVGNPNANILTYKTAVPRVPIVVAPTKEEATGYEYSYVVYDENTGDHKAQRELSDGSVVRGEYSFLQPDGYVREVQYVADDVSGFNAVVKNFLPVAVEGKRKVEVKSKKESSPPCQVTNESLKEGSDEKSEETVIVESKESSEESKKESGEEEESKKKQHGKPKQSKEESGEETNEESKENLHKKSKTSKEESDEQLEEKQNKKSKKSKEESEEKSKENNSKESKNCKEDSREESNAESEEKLNKKSEFSKEESGEESNEKPQKNNKKDSKESNKSGEESESDEPVEELKEELREPKEKHKKKSKKESSASEEEPYERLTPGKHKEAHELTKSKPELEVQVPYNDILRCIQAAIRRANEVPSAMREDPSPLTYIVLNTPC